MKSYSTHFKCHVIFANELMKKQESLLSGGGDYPEEREEYTLNKYSSRNMYQRLSLAEWGVGVAHTFCQQHIHTHILQNITLP